VDEPVAAQAGTSVDGFLDSLAARDFDRLEACLAASAQARLLLPRRVEELAGGDQIRGRLEGWFGAASEFSVVASRRDEIGGRQRATWRFRLVRDGRSWELIEQTAFIDVGPDGIQRIDLLCSGFMRDSKPEAAPAHVFDAGDMGCADGLAQEFRKQIASVEVGSSMVAIVRDPAAIEDIPPLARLLGHSVTSVEAQGEGTFKITVERRK
jgi:TusA-related sulfurtransferase